MESDKGKNRENLNIAIAGLGTVGVSVVKILNDKKDLLALRAGKDLSIKAVSARDKKRDRGVNLDGIKWYEKAADIASDDEIDLVVELIGGDSGAAYDLCVKSLQAGKSVVTANKALISKHGKELALLAEENGVDILFEAAVAAAIPILKILKDSLNSNIVTSSIGILNGTCNYILSVMEEKGEEFDVVLKKAQDLGYAEADPTFDIDGIDAAHKNSIIGAIIFSSIPDLENMEIKGIREISLDDINYLKKLGYKIRLLAISQKLAGGKVRQIVAPFVLSENHPLALVGGAHNSIMLEGDLIDDLVITGHGAGGKQTASAIVNDIIDVAVARGSKSFNIDANLLTEIDKSSYVLSGESVNEYYIRLPKNADYAENMEQKLMQLLAEKNIKLQQSFADDRNSILIISKILESDLLNLIQDSGFNLGSGVVFIPLYK